MYTNSIFLEYLPTLCTSQIIILSQGMILLTKVLKKLSTSSSLVLILLQDLRRTLHIKIILKLSSYFKSLQLIKLIIDFWKCSNALSIKIILIVIVGITTLHAWLMDAFSFINLFFIIINFFRWDVGRG